MNTPKLKEYPAFVDGYRDKHLWMHQRIFSMPKGNFLRQIRENNILCIEQNPKKICSKYAVMSNAGKKISWLFVNNQYYSKVIDGFYERC